MVYWEPRGKVEKRLVDDVNGITTGWHRTHTDCLRDWKRIKKKNSSPKV